MQVPTGQLPNQPAIDGAKRQFARFGLFPRAFHVVENPDDLARGKVGVDQQAGFFLNGLLQSLFAKTVADGRCAPVLPDNGVIHGISGFAIPHDGGFALIRDAQRGDIARPGVGTTERFNGYADLGGPDIFRIVFHPTGARIMLLKFALGSAVDGAALIEQNGARTGGSLIQGKDVFHTDLSYSLPACRISAAGKS